MMMMTGALVLLMTTYLQPVSYDVYSSGILIPSLFARIGLLENSLRTVPRLAFGAGILAYGSTVIGSRVFRDYMDWRALNPPHKGWGSTGWVPTNGWQSERLQRLHGWYERNSQRGTVRGHRAIDFLAFTLARSRKRFRTRMQARLQRAQTFLATRAAASEGGWGGWEGSGYAVGHTHVEHAPHPHPHPHPAPVVVHEPVPVDVGPEPVSYSVGPGPSYGPHTYESGPEYIPSSYGAGVSHYSQGPTASKYFPSPSAAGHTSYGGYGAYSSQVPARASSSGGYGRSGRSSGSGSGSSPREQEPLSSHEFESLMAWAEGKPLDLNPEALRSSGPRTVRIKRQQLHPRPPKKVTATRRPTSSASASRAVLLPDLIDDVGRFFTVIEYLDENKCLQKFVCNVHSRAKSFLPERMVKDDLDMSPFESSVVAAFKVLDTFMPVDDESYKAYRAAALIGARAANETTCTAQYRSCSLTAADIIDMNSKIEAKAVEAEKQKAVKAKAVAKAKAKTTTTTTTSTTTQKPAVKRRPKNKKVTTASTTTTAPSTTTEATTTTTIDAPEQSDESAEYYMEEEDYEVEPTVTADAA